MRSYIFTDEELDAIRRFLETGKRNPTFNKVLHYIRRNRRLLDEVEILLTLIQFIHRPRSVKPKLPPGRPPKILRGL